jgi:hypothetical protein
VAPRVSVGSVLAACLALLHLLTVVLFIWADWPERTPRELNAALRTYQNLSGTFRDYAFFAPAVGSDLKAAFVLQEAGGGSRLVPFLSDNKEVAFRYNCIILACMRDVRGRDLFAQSWAALVLGAEPQVERVGVVVKEYSLPPMAAYRDGRRPRWETIYLGDFARGAGPAGE